MIYCNICINELVYRVYINIILNNYVKKENQHTDMQIRQCFECLWGLSMNANKEMLAGYAYPDGGYYDADPDAY